MRAPRTTLVAFCLLSTLGPITMAAQEEPPEEEAARKWANTTELALVQTDGNSESFTFSLRDSFTWNWEKASLTSELFALRAESAVRVLTNEGGEVQESSESELTGEQYSLSSKYSRELSDRFGWYVDAGWERNRLAGLDNRFGVGGGFSHLFIDNEVRNFLGEAGLGYRDETPVSGSSEGFVFGRLFGRYERAITETSGFETELELIGNLEDTDDYVASFLVAVTARISAKLALRMSYTLAYRGRPIVIVVPGDDVDEADGMFEFDAADSILSASLVIAF